MVYAPLLIVADIIGEPFNQCLYFFVILMSFAACLVLGQIDNISTRKWFSTISGFIIGLYFYGILWYFNLGYILVNYLLMRFLPRYAAANAMMAFSVFGMVYATCYRNWWSPADAEISYIDLIFEMNFIKLHMITVNYRNAGLILDK